jgi:hypothetical protein
VRNFLVTLLCVLAGAALLSAQAVTDFETATGVVAAIVETPGGDVEHFAAALPKEASVPTAVLGFPVEASSASTHKIVQLTVPSRLATLALLEISKVFASDGFIALVALGPVPARDLSTAVEALPAARRSRPGEGRCVIADGGLEVLRGTADRVDLSFAAPGPDDPRFDLLPGLAGALQRRLASPFPGVRVDVATAGQCASLVVRVPAVADETPATLARLRDAIRTFSGARPPSDALAAVQRQLERRRLRWAADGRATAKELVERAATGARVAGGLVAPGLDPDGLAALAREVFVGHVGFARIIEQERRAVGAEVHSLENGVTVSLNRLPADVGVVSLAFSGLVTSAAHAILGEFGGRAADRGWFAQRSDVLGIPAGAAVLPPEDVVEALELVAACVAGGKAQAEAPLEAMISKELGLRAKVYGSGVSIAIGVPAGIDEVGEACAKFFSGVPPAGVTSQALDSGPALQWEVTDETPHMIAVVSLTASQFAPLAGQIIIERLRDHPTSSARWLGVPGRLTLLVEAVGGSDVPALDTQQASVWQKVCRPVDAETVGRAANALADSLYGDLLKAASRHAAERFLPSIDAPEALVAADPRDLSILLRALPRWEELRRFARGPGPDTAAHGRATVRESPPRP